MSRLLVLPAVVATVALLSGCQEKNAFVPPPPPAVTVALPLEKNVVDYFQTTGQTRAVNTVELRARVNGYLHEITFKDGDVVKQGDLLFVIDKAPYEAALASAKADVAKAEAQLRLATAQLGRTRTLVERKAATKDQLDEVEAQRSSALADVAAARAAIRQAELDLGYAEIRAPFAGRMGEHQVDIGNLVQSGTTLLATLESRDPIHAYFNVSESDLLRFLDMKRAGAVPMDEATASTIEMALGESDDFSYRGRMDFGEFGVDPSTGTTLRRAVFENADERLVPGLFVRIRVAVGEPRPRLLVEERAVSADQRGDYLLVVNDKNVVEYRPVTLGRADAGLRVIEEGIRPGDWVVVNGLQRARPGAPVQPEQAQMAGNPDQQPTAFRFAPETSAVARKK
ncbi:MAG: efflux RND transporter periplasmic adaptor subunit [Planctomycetaceae bacterium]